MKEYDYKAIPYKERLTTLHAMCLQSPVTFHKNAREYSKYSLRFFSSDEKFDNASVAQSLCAIALNQYNVIHIDIQQFVSKYPVIKDMVARLTKELLFDVKMEILDVTLFDETDLVRTLKDIFSQKREKFIFIIDEWDSIFRYIGTMQRLRRNIWIFCGIF